MLTFVLSQSAQHGAMPIDYPYTYLRYGWEVDEKSAYSTFDFSVKILGLTLFAPLVNRVLKLKNVTVLIFVLCTSFSQYFIQAIAWSGAMYYVGKQSLCLQMFLHLYCYNFM